MLLGLNKPHIYRLGGSWAVRWEEDGVCMWKDEQNLRVVYAEVDAMWRRVNKRRGVETPKKARRIG